MSYEGYTVIICENGHITTQDAYNDAFEVHIFKCPDCGAAEKMRAEVDETNGLPYYLNFKVYEVTEAVVKKCECCGTIKEVMPATHRMEYCEYYKSEDGNWILPKQEEE